ncbi:cytoskeletal protein binding protein [Ascosphaera pollenicola]|nr:cytoskeletal protein binding protein [Ascosphaera pollenicola]
MDQNQNEDRKMSIQTVLTDLTRGHVLLAHRLVATKVNPGDYRLVVLGLCYGNAEGLEYTAHGGLVIEEEEMVIEPNLKGGIVDIGPKPDGDGDVEDGNDGSDSEIDQVTRCCCGERNWMLTDDHICPGFDCGPMPGGCEAGAEQDSAEPPCLMDKVAQQCNLLSGRIGRKTANTVAASVAASVAADGNDED